MGTDVRRVGQRWGPVGVLCMIAGLVLSAFLLGARARGLDPGVHERYSTHLARLEALDHRLNEDLMRARTGLLANYDPLVSTMRDLERIHTYLADTPDYLDEEGRRSLSETVRASRVALTEQAELLERFKSQNAVLLNSLRFLPTAADSLTARIPERAVVSAADALVRDVLVLNLWNESEAVERVRAALRELRDRLTALGAREDLELLELHTRVITDRRPRVQHLLEQVLALHARRDAHRLDELYRSYYAIAATRAQTDDILVFCLALASVVAIAAAVILRMRRAAEALRQTSAELAAAVDTKNRFVSMTSHEFRTPLSVILSSTELLEAYSERWGAEKRRQHYERIRASIQGMSQLIDGVLLIGRGEAGVLDFKPGATDVDRICQEVIAAVKLRTERDHELVYERPEVTEVVADERLLKHILDNLLTNAIKYSPRGGEVTLSARCDGRALVFAVQDRGIGIPDRDRARLFEGFHRGSNVGAIPGTGLGLAVVKRAIDLHGGEVRVRSEVGAGTRFEVSIPLEERQPS